MNEREGSLIHDFDKLTDVVQILARTVHEVHSR